MAVSTTIFKHKLREEADVIEQQQNDDVEEIKSAHFDKIDTKKLTHKNEMKRYRGNACTIRTK